MESPDQWRLMIEFEDDTERQVAEDSPQLGGLAEAFVAGLLAALMAEETATLRLFEVGSGRIALEGVAWPHGAMGVG